MLYKKNSTVSLADGLFKNPTAEYRGTPFWAWNALLTKTELERQIDIFKKMGLGGFHMHVRTGLKNTYLSDEYMELVKACVEKAKSEEMLAWLYDEDRWPSGAAGGLVTKDEKYRARMLVFTPFFKEDCETLLACYDITLDENGFIKSYKRINKDDAADGEKWYAFLKIETPSGWHNDQTYVDTLSREAMERFIEVTHERYKEKVGYAFDETVPAIFTDEPQFTRKGVLNNAFDRTDIKMPWTDKLPELYKEYYGADIFETLPEVFWDLPQHKPSLARYRYHVFIAELFARSFADTIGGWCKENNIALTGHMMEEPTLRSQCAALGEAMRSYRSFQLPGIDMLCNRLEMTTAKQAQSAVHQYGYEGMLSELYGVTGWDCDFRTYKYQGDWQAALGVTIRVPHLSWYAMGGEAKRDYPASISYQSPWYEKYNRVEDHFARVNTALTRGKPVIKVGVIHPIESFWLHWGPNDSTALLRESLDERFSNVTEWLLEGSIDFNFISESLLPSLCSEAGAPLKVGKMEYDAIVVPGCETLRRTTLERLEKFAACGGKLIFMGDAPRLVDAVPCDDALELYNKSFKADFSRASVLSALEENRTVTLRFANGRLTDNLIYQLRDDGDCEWLFVCHDKEPYNKDTDGSDKIRITVKGIFKPQVYNTQNGEIEACAASYENGCTVIEYTMSKYDSLLLKLIKGKRAESAEAKPFADMDIEGENTVSLVEYELSEDNALLLDIAEFKLSGESEFSPAEEILRLDNICRERLGLRKRGGSVVQPWVYGETAPIDKVTLRYTFESKIEVNGAHLALEDADKAEIVFNGEKVSDVTDETYVDIAILKVKLPVIKKGVNILEVTYPFGASANLEAMVVLGKFGIELAGTKAVICELPEKLAFGDITKQGFPFYGGNITYKVPVESDGGSILFRVSDYRGAMVGVKANGTEGDIIYPPYCVNLPLNKGKNIIDVTLYGHRYNTFGPLHLVNVKESWHGPGAWRSSGANWSYEYVLRTVGILSAPQIIK